jgi:hypothetical protein
MVLMCLGSETVISVVPKSGFREPALVPTPGVDAGTSVVLGITIDTNELIPMDVDTDTHARDGDMDVIMGELEPEAEQGQVSALPVKETGERIDPPEAVGGKGKGRAPAAAARKSKFPKQDISVTLLHGDMMMLTGDDFEVSRFNIYKVGGTCADRLFFSFFFFPLPRRGCSIRSNERGRVFVC